MITNAANILFVINILINLYILLLVVINNIVECQYKLRDKNLVKLFYFNNSIIIVNYLLLTYAFVVSDFTISNVFSHSSNIMPLKYKIMGPITNHEGSMLLFVTIMSVISMIYIYQLKSKLFDKFAKNFIWLYSFVNILFVIFIYLYSNPFIKFTDKMHNGLGLNPSLQDAALLIHPPILYIGYILTIIPFINNLIPHKNITNQHNIILMKFLMKYNKIYILYAIFFMIAGISLGGWWAYRELGWGGYWFFDPIENISLLPLFASIIYLHFLNSTLYRQKNNIFTSIFSIIPFLIILYATTFVRSGVLDSVHSFAFSKNRGVYLFIISTVITLVSIYALYKNIKHNLQQNAKITKVKNNLLIDDFILIGNIFWLISIIAILIAVIYPIYYNLLWNIEVVIDHSYYKQIWIPLFIFISIFAAQAIYLHKKKKYDLFGYLALIVKIILTYCISRYFIIYMNQYKLTNFMQELLIYSSIYLIIENIYYLLFNVLFNIFFVKSQKKNKKKITTILAIFFSHFGFGMLIFFITVNSHTSRKIDFYGQINNKQCIYSANSQDIEFIVRLNDIKYHESADINYVSERVNFVIEDIGNNSIYNLYPENRLYKIENILSKESSISYDFTKNIYIVISNIKDQYVSAEIHIQPFISYIILSIILMLIGILLSIFSRKTPL